MIKKLSETKGATTFKLLQVGESGAGKTYRSLSAVEFGPMFVVDTDGKLEGYVSQLSDDVKEKILYKKCNNVDDVLEALNYVNDNIDNIATVVLDTWSRWHDFMMDFHTSQNVAKRVSVKGYDGKSIQQKTMPDWGAIKENNRKFLLNLLSLNANVIVNTHVGKATDATDRQVLTVGTSGSFGETMPQYFPETHYLYIDPISKEYRVRGRRGGNIVANSSLSDDLFNERGEFKNTKLNTFKGIAKEVADVK